MGSNIRASAEPAAVKAKEIEGDTQGKPSRITRLMKSTCCIQKELYGGMVGRRYVSTPWLGAWSMLWPGNRRGVTMWVFDVIAVHRKRSHAEFWSYSTVFCRLYGVVLYWLLFWARTWGALPDWSTVRRRVTSLTNHSDLSIDAFCVLLVQRN